MSSLTLEQLKPQLVAAGVDFTVLVQSADNAEDANAAGFYSIDPARLEPLTEVDGGLGHPRVRTS